MDSFSNREECTSLKKREIGLPSTDNDESITSSKTTNTAEKSAKRKQKRKNSDFLVDEELINENDESANLTSRLPPKVSRIGRMRRDWVKVAKYKDSNLDLLRSDEETEELDDRPSYMQSILLLSVSMLLIVMSSFIYNHSDSRIFLNHKINRGY